MATLGTDQLFALLGVHEFLPSVSVVSWLEGSLCGFRPELCVSFLAALCGYRKGAINETQLPLYLKYTPAGTSVQVRCARLCGAGTWQSVCAALGIAVRCHMLLAECCCSGRTLMYGISCILSQRAHSQGIGCCHTVCSRAAVSMQTKAWTQKSKRALSPPLLIPRTWPTGLKLYEVGPCPATPHLSSLTTDKTVGQARGSVRATRSSMGPLNLLPTTWGRFGRMHAWHCSLVGMWVCFEVPHRLYDRV